MPPSPDKLKKVSLIALISIATLVIDFFTKGLIVKNISRFEHIDVTPFLRIVHIENKGAAFGMFSQLGNNVFIFIAVIAIIFILMYLLKLPVGLELYSLSLVLGGAAGNLLDRIIFGKVIDFIDIYVNDWHWPAFNVADSALTVGITLFIISNLFHRKRPT
jgi:signal peptidase II